MIVDEVVGPQTWPMSAGKRDRSPSAKPDDQLYARVALAVRTV
jgi:hypothetical protein